MCRGMIQQHVEEKGVVYRYVIRQRPELLYIQPFPDLASLDLGSEEEPIVRYGSTRASCCGNEDKLGVGNFKVEFFLSPCRASLSRSIRPWNSGLYSTRCNRAILHPHEERSCPVDNLLLLLR